MAKLSYEVSWSMVNSLQAQMDENKGTKTDTHSMVFWLPFLFFKQGAKNDWKASVLYLQPNITTILEKEDVELQTRFNWLNYTAQWRAILINPTNVRTPQNQGKPISRTASYDSARKDTFASNKSVSYASTNFRYTVCALSTLVLYDKECRLRKRCRHLEVTYSCSGHDTFVTIVCISSVKSFHDARYISTWKARWESI